MRDLLEQNFYKLIEKYSGSVPRYTSYPTAPEWKQEYNHQVLLDAIAKSNAGEEDFSIYLHLPFCESQCYFCGCNVIISKEHGIEEEYLLKLKSEILYYAERIDSKRRVSQIAWGGGTPTFLRPAQIEDLMLCIRDNFNLYDSSEPNHEYSIEIDPRVTTVEHLRVLFQQGFNRLSLGLQDFNPQTQETINRIQGFDMTRNLIEAARDIGFNSINVDLIYGLPYQTQDTFSRTLEQIHALNPDRIALFNYAHIPSIFPFQAKYIPDAALPDAQTKLAIFTQAVNSFTEAHYEFIGLDHFARPNDSLTEAQKNKTLYRNFQGYSTHAGADLFGFGITAISDISGVYKQNHKKLSKYYDDFLGADKFLAMTEDDLLRRQIIRNIMCNNFAEISNKIFDESSHALEGFVDDGLIKISKQNNSAYYIEVTQIGRFFVRNIASSFDIYLKQASGHKVFSQAL